MNTSASVLSPWLRVVAVLQGVAIAVLAIVLLRRDDPVPANASPPAAPSNAAVASPAEVAVAPASPPAAPPNAAVANPAGVAVAPASAPTALLEPQPAQAASAAAAATGDAVGTVLYGRIVDEAGEAVPDGIVWLSRPDDNKQLATLRANARDPVFAIAGLQPGEIAYRTRAAGYKETAATITIPPDTPRLQHDIVLAKAWLLTVRILTPDGKPVRAALSELAKERRMLFHVEVGAIATATRPEGDMPLTALREITAGLGRWRGDRFGGAMRGEKQLPKDVAGELELDGKQAIWVSAVLRHRVLASLQVEPGQSDVTLTVAVDQVLNDLGTIRGRVVDATTREPVAGANIGFGDLQSSGSAGKSSADGAFEVRDLRPGLLDVEIHSAKGQAARDLVVLQPGQDLDLGDVPLAEYRTITGHCEGVVGKAESCAVKYTQLEPPSHASLRRLAGHASVAADGGFKLYLMEGRYLLRASGAGGAVMEIDTRTLPDGPLVLQLAKETNLRLDVQSNGEPFELALFDSRGREVYRRDLQHGWKFALPFLPGDYRIELKDGRGKITTRSLTLGDAGADLRVP